MLSKSCQEKIYKEIKEDILRKLSVGLDVSISKLEGILGGEIRKECILLPWCGEGLEGRCMCLRLNNGLHTQCRKMRCNESEYCESCLRSIEGNGGVAIYGTVKERMKVGILDYIDSKGRKTIPYANIMKKLNISREEAELEASKLGWTIPECHFVESKGKRGRPKKETGVCDTESETSSIGEKKKRGRPKKRKEVKNESAGEDIIAGLLEQNVSEELKEEEVVVVEEEVVDEEVVDEEVDDEETEVVKFSFEGKEFLKSEENILYDIESHDAVGIWNEKEKKIDEIPDDED